MFSSHDLRATMITLNLAHGKNEAWIMDCTGHKSSAQIQAYRREVALAVARKLPPLRPLNEVIPELATSKGGGRPRGPGKAPPSRGPKAGSKGAQSASASPDEDEADEAIGPDSGTRLREPARNTAPALAPLGVSSGREEAPLVVSPEDLETVGDKTDAPRCGRLRTERVLQPGEARTARQGQSWWREDGRALIVRAPKSIRMSLRGLLSYIEEGHRSRANVRLRKRLNAPSPPAQPAPSTQTIRLDEGG